MALTYLFIRKYFLEVTSYLESVIALHTKTHFLVSPSDYMGYDIEET